MLNLTLDAFDGNKLALKKVVQEYHLYEQKKTKGTLTETEAKLFADIQDTLEILSPQTLPPLPAPEIKRITVEKPVKDVVPVSDVSFSSQAAEQKFNEQSFFDLKDGFTYVYSGKNKKFIRGEWADSGKILKSHILNKKQKKKETETQTLTEVFSKQEQWLCEQIFVTYKVSPSGVEIRRKVVFSQPVPGVIAPIGEQEGYTILRFPIRKDTFVAGYRVDSTTESVKTPLKDFTNCLSIKGQIESFVFAAGNGLVLNELFDEQWLLKEQRPPPWEVNPSTLAPSKETTPAAEPDLEGLTKSIAKKCKTRKVKLDGIVSIHFPEKAGSAFVRYLAVEKDKQDPDQRRFYLTDEKWRKTSDKTWRLAD